MYVCVHVCIFTKIIPSDALWFIYTANKGQQERIIHYIFYYYY